MSVIETTLAVSPNFKIDYGAELEAEIAHLQNEITQRPGIADQCPDRWLAIKLLEEDRDIQIKLLALEGGASLIEAAQKSIVNLQANPGDDLDIQIADRRYRWINQLVQEAVERPAIEKKSLTDQIDRIVTHRYLGIPIFFIIMWVVFKLTAEVSAPYLDWINGFRIVPAVSVGTG